MIELNYTYRILAADEKYPFVRLMIAHRTIAQTLYIADPYFATFQESSVKVCLLLFYLDVISAINGNGYNMWDNSLLMNFEIKILKIRDKRD